MTRATTPIRILYVPGAADVLQTYDHWRTGRPDPTQMHETYSGQFFSLCREMGWEALVISAAERFGAARGPGLEIRQRPIPFERAHWVLYHAGQIWEGVRLAVSARRFGADIVLVGWMRHWFALLAVRLAGVPVVPSLFCTLWSARTGPPPDSLGRRLNRKLFASSAAVLTMSRRITDQVKELTRTPPARLREFLPVYDRRLFSSLPPPPEPREPFRVLFVGRIERYKGVLDLLAAAQILHGDGETGIEFDLCGDGPAAGELSRSVYEAGLANEFRLHGHCDRGRLSRLLGAAHAVVVPTRSEFIEGFNQVIAEAILAGRPVVTSAVCPAIDYVKSAVVEVAPDDPAGYARAIARLRHDPELYAEKRARCLDHQPQFYEAANSWRVAVREVVTSLTASQQDR